MGVQHRSASSTDKESESFLSKYLETNFARDFVNPNSYKKEQAALTAE
jgi:hypothetical protein